MSDVDDADRGGDGAETTGPISARLRALIRAEQPVSLAPVVDGVGVGNHLLVRPTHEPVGTLGDPDLDRVVARDALGELESATLVPRLSVAFVRYRSRLSAEFALQAMANQSLGRGERRDNQGRP